MSFISERAVLQRLGAAFLAVIATAALSAQSPWPHARARSRSQDQNHGVGRPFVAGRMLVKFHAEVTELAAHAIFKEEGASCGKELAEIGVHVVSLPSGASEQGLIRAFAARPEVEFAELDLIAEPSALTPNDPMYPQQSHLPKIGAPTAWSTTTGSSSVVIAVIDTGILATHEDLAGNLVPGRNIPSNNTDTSPYTAHGTRVAGVAAAASDNGKGVASGCWNCSIMPIRVTSTTGSNNVSDIAGGIIWAADHGARVATMGFGGPEFTSQSTLTSAAQYLRSAGGILVMPAGNSGTFSSTPDNPYMLTISATDENDVLHAWSNTGNMVDLSAPGCVFTTDWNGGYTQFFPICGTSYSMPIVASVAALVLSANPGLTAAQVETILKQSADDLGSPGWDPQYGWGRINAAAAVALAGGGSDSTPPSVSITSPANGATVSGTITVAANASDNVGVSKVEFYLGGSLKATDTTSPYTYSWNTTTASNGAHTPMARAYDAAGNIASHSISVTADNSPPSVSITSPANGATVSGTITVAANASDNVGVSKVEFYVDGSLKATDTSSPYTYSWNTTSLANGAHTPMARAYDAAGNIASHPISVTVSNEAADTTPPTVTITSPTNGATVSGTTTLAANASDNVGVSKVEFYVDGSLKATDTSSPYTYSWNTTTVANGAHTLLARAYDAAGNIASHSIPVTVSNGTADTTPPSVTITAPANGSQTPKNGQFTVQASASDNVGVTSVTFGLNGATQCTETTSPYSCSMRAGRGSNSVVVTATDAAGNAASRSITVQR